MNLVIKQFVLDIVQAVMQDKENYSEISNEILQEATDEVKEEVLALTSWLAHVDAIRDRVMELCADHDCTEEDLGFNDEMADVLLVPY